MIKVQKCRVPRQGHPLVRHSSVPIRALTQQPPTRLGASGGDGKRVKQKNRGVKSARDEIDDSQEHLADDDHGIWSRCL